MIDREEMKKVIGEIAAVKELRANRPKCKKCSGRGWVAGKPNTWANYCPECKGKGRHSIPVLARLYKVSTTTLYRYFDSEKRAKLRPKTLERIEKGIAEESAR